METETERVSRVLQLTTPPFEITEHIVHLDPTYSVEKWCEEVDKLVNYHHEDFTTENFGKFIRTRESEVVKDTVVAFRAGKGKNATREWARDMRAFLNLDPAGFEHMAAMIRQHQAMWCGWETRWFFSPDIIREVEGEPPKMLGIIGDSSFYSRLFSVTTYTNFDGTVWFCGVKKRS